MSHHLVGVAEIARMFGVSRQRVDEIVARSADFPEPQARLSAGRVWSRSAVERWMKRHGRRRGRRMDELKMHTRRLVDYVENRYRLRIGDKTAQVVLDLLGSEGAVTAGTCAEIKGRSLDTGEATKLVLRAADVHHALSGAS